MDLQRWRRMHLSLMGRISVVKKNVLPKMLFLFQTVAVINSVICFKQWQTDITTIIWQGKRPIISFNNLTNVKEREGLTLPNLKLQHEAACLTWLKEWVTLMKITLLDLGGIDRRYGWHSYLWHDKVKVHKDFLNHYIRSLLGVWRRNKNLLEHKKNTYGYHQ